LRNASPTAISTYAYVNPAIAVALGWAIAGESMTGQMLIGAGIIVASVALITLNKSKANVENQQKFNTATMTRADQPDLSASA
jgi:drug/metabolite transporter (DMT)-like permease